MKEKLNEDIRFILGLIAGLRQVEASDDWLLALLVEQLEGRRRMLEALSPAPSTRIGAGRYEC